FRCASREVLLYCVQLRERLTRGDARSETPDCDVVERPEHAQIVLRRREWLEELRAWKRHVEAVQLAELRNAAVDGEHAHDDMRQAVECDRAADNRRIGIEPCRP